MSKALVINELREKNGYSKNDAEIAFEASINAIKSVVEAGGEVRAAPLGTFRQKAIPAKNGVMPGTGKPGSTPARKVISFKPAAKA